MWIIPTSLRRVSLTLLTAALFALPGPPPAALAVGLPDIGDASGSVVTPTEEKKTGEAVMRNIRRSGGMIDDPLLESYINHLGYRLVAAGDSRMTDYNFFVINDRDINAFALPGGYIGVFYGLILATNNESELASVMAHEIAHVSQRHHARAYDFGGNSSVPVVAAIIAAILLGAQSNELGQAAMTSIAAGSIQQQINFTRANEKEADHVGMELLARAGFDPHGMATFFEQLHKTSRLYGSQAPEFLRTHPVHETRIADSRNRASQLAPAQAVEDSDLYHLMRARIQVLAAVEQREIRDRFAADLQNNNYRHEAATRYGYALSLINTGDYAQARKQLQQLLANDPHRIAYLIAQADLAYQQGDTDQALRHYQAASTMYPNNPALVRGHSQTLLRAKQPEAARNLLQDYLRQRDRDPVFYRLLAEAEAGLGLTGPSQLAMGEYYYRIGQTHQAVAQFNLALQNTDNDFYTSSRIEARLQELQAELAALNPDR